jgi:hypothetical protein
MPSSRRWSECRADGSGNAVGAKERTYTLPGAHTSNILVVQPRTEESTLVLQLHVKHYLSSNRGAPPGRNLAPRRLRIRSATSARSVIGLRGPVHTSLRRKRASSALCTTIWRHLM